MRTGGLPKLAWCSLAAVLVLLPAALAHGQEPASAASSDASAEVTAHIRYVSGESLYLDKGSNDGIAPGDVAIVKRNGVGIARLRVVTVSSSSAATEVEELFGDETPDVGDEVVLRVTAPPAPADAEPLKQPEPSGPPPDIVVPPGTGSGSVRNPDATDEPFVPLLAPRVAKAGEKSWVLNGNIRASATWTEDWTEGIESFSYRLSTRGTALRAFGGPFSLQWDIAADFKNGAGNRSSMDYENLELHVSELAAAWHMDPNSQLVLGRMQTRTLPALGRIDGLALEWGPSQTFRIGAAGGFRPDGQNWEPTSREVIAAIYGSGRLKDGDVNLFSALGLMTTWFEGASDRQAAFTEVRLGVGKAFHALVSGEFDFYDANDTIRSGIGLTRLNATLRGSIGIVTLRLSWHQNQLPDTLEQLDTVSDTSLYTDGSRRLLFSISEKVDDFTFDQEFTWWSGSGTSTDWQVGVRARDNHAFDSHIWMSLGLSWRDGDETDRYGGQFSFNWTPDPYWSVHLGYDFAVVRPEGSDGVADIPQSIVSLDLTWIISPTLTGALTTEFSFSDENAASTLGFSITLRY